MDIKGIKTTINFRHDLKMGHYWKQWTVFDVFECVKVTRAGLIYLIDPDGDYISVPKRNCTAFDGVRFC